jgi:hypothetical protein
MKKKHRKITVDDVEYGWVLNKQDDENGEWGLSIYNNNKFWKSLWTKEHPITPKFVAEMIEKYEKGD